VAPSNVGLLKVLIGASTWNSCARGPARREKRHIILAAVNVVARSSDNVRPLCAASARARAKAIVRAGCNHIRRPLAGAEVAIRRPPAITARKTRTKHELQIPVVRGRDSRLEPKLPEQPTFRTARPRSDGEALVKVVVFTGPTLSAEEARVQIDASFLPPVSEGDVYRASVSAQSDRHHRRILQRGTAVWHKEILWAMSQGIHVFGSASMGALRAAELAAFGMEELAASTRLIARVNSR